MISSYGNIETYHSSATRKRNQSACFILETTADKRLPVDCNFSECVPTALIVASTLRRRFTGTEGEFLRMPSFQAQTELGTS